MLETFRPPSGCQEGIVVADAAYASREHLALIQELGYWFVVTLPRTWTFTTGKAVKALVTSCLAGGTTRSCMPTVNNQRRRAFWG